MVEVGEQVYIAGRYSGPGSIGIVERITPTGRLVVGGIQYRAPSKQDKDDWCALQTGDGWSGGLIRKLTPSRIEEVKKAKVRSRIDRMKNTYSIPSDASLDDLIAISAAWETIMNLVRR